MKKIIARSMLWTRILSPLRFQNLNREYLISIAYLTPLPSQTEVFEEVEVHDYVSDGWLQSVLVLLWPNWKWENAHYVRFRGRRRSWHHPAGGECHSRAQGKIARERIRVRNRSIVRGNLQRPNSRFISWAKRKHSERHNIVTAPEGGCPTVAGVVREYIDSVSAAAALVRKATAARAVEATEMNTHSSRSHTLFLVYITGVHIATGTQLSGCLNLVDLAGSERTKRSGAKGTRMSEACAINKSLSCLGDVFASIARGISTCR